MRTNVRLKVLAAAAVVLGALALVGLLGLCIVGMLPDGGYVTPDWYSGYQAYWCRFHRWPSSAAAFEEEAPPWSKDDLKEGHRLGLTVRQVVVGGKCHLFCRWPGIGGPYAKEYVIDPSQISCGDNPY